MASSVAWNGRYSPNVFAERHEMRLVVERDEAACAVEHHQAVVGAASRAGLRSGFEPQRAREEVDVVGQSLADGGQGLG